MAARGIVFDFGNTLVPWGEQENARLLAALESAFRPFWGPCDDFAGRVLRVRASLDREHEERGLEEGTLPEFVDALWQGPAPEELHERARAAFHESFLQGCRPPPGRLELLRRLAQTHRLAVLSNFLLSETVEAVLARAGWRDAFDAVVVSAAHGVRKPHPLLFQRVREKLDLPASSLLMVGDDFWADVVGGSRAGFDTALTREFLNGPSSDPRAPDVRPGRILESLDVLGQS